jgi:hypothetical protein
MHNSLEHIQNMKNTVFWDAASWNPVEFYRLFIAFILKAKDVLPWRLRQCHATVTTDFEFQVFVSLLNFGVILHDIRVVLFCLFWTKY